jgi:hypothetical protein
MLGVPTPAETTAEFIVEHVARAHPKSVRQAARHSPLPCASRHPALRLFAEHHVAGVRELEATALCAWQARPEMAMLLRRPADVLEIVRLQAAGQRCVSLLDDGTDANPLEFALHDLRHLGKFFDGAHHLAQRGFFLSVKRAFESTAWARLDEQLDERWRADRDAALSDMNGSPVFLCSVLKMKLKMAARRRLARVTGSAAPERGAPTQRELAEFSALFELWLDGLELTGAVRAAAKAISCRRDAAGHAEAIVRHFAFLVRVAPG